MAVKHRKLYPVSETNQTIDCKENCGFCPYGCFPYPEYSSAPPPPSPPPPLSAKQGNHVSPYIIIIVTLLGSVFLLLSYYMIVVKYCSPFRRTSVQSNGPDEEFLDQNHGPLIDHPIWFINTIGLQPSVINSITVVKYNKGGSLIEGTDCSVCLNEFQEDETLRLLPKCNHAFHIPCIDTWLRSHTNCPLCRAGILSNPWNVSMPSNDHTSPNLGSNGNTQMENSEIVGELEGNQVGEGEVFENRAETGEGIDFPQGEDEGKEIENSKGGNELVVEKMIQPMRRCVSMDGAAEITLTVREFRSIDCEGSLAYPTMGSPKFDGTEGHAGNSRLIRMMGGSSIAQSLHKGPLLMKRSFSYSGRSVFSRH